MWFGSMDVVKYSKPPASFGSDPIAIERKTKSASMPLLTGKAMLASAALSTTSTEPRGCLQATFLATYN